LTEEQSQIIRELKLVDPEPIYKGFSELPSSNKNIDPEEPKTQDIDLLYEVDYDYEHAKIR
jgi:hypothetical protein